MAFLSTRNDRPKVYNKKSVWSREREAALIDLIYEVPPLWNPLDPNYVSRSSKKILYENVAEEMGRRWPEYADVFTGAIIQEKFGSLRSYFQKEKRRLNTRSRAGYEIIPKWVHYHPKWIHYERLLFLKDNNKESSAEKPLEITSVKSLAKSPFSISEGEQDEENSTSLPIEADTCTVEEDVEIGLGMKRKETPISLPIEEDSTCTTEGEDIETVTPRKRRETESEAVSNSAFQNSQSQPSVSSSIAQMVHATLTNLTPEDGSQCAQEIFGVILKYIKSPEKLNCTK